MILSANLFKPSIPFRTSLRVLILSAALLAITAGASFALDHSGVIAANETWFVADNPHVITGNVTVNAGVTLTLEPGVEVYANASRNLTIRGDLNAVGTVGQPILFTRNSGSNWSYISFETNGGGTLDHCVIEYCTYGIFASSNAAINLTNATVRNATYGIYSVGTNAMVVSDCQFQDNTRGIFSQSGTLDLSSTSFTANTAYGIYGIGVVPTFSDANITFDGNGTGVRIDDVASLILTDPLSITGSTEAGLHFDNCDGVMVDNQTLSGTTGAKGAFYVDDCGEFTLGASNSIGGAGLENSWPVTIGMGSFPAAAGVIPTSGNTNNDIQVAGGSSTAVGTWRKFIGLDYVVTTNGTVDAGGELTIEPGVTVRLNASRRLSFRGDLVAVGTVGQEIVFTKNSGSNWSYLIFETNGNGTFDHCLMEYATYGVYANSTGTISLNNSTLSNCTYGIFSPQSNAVSISNCVLQDNSYGVSASGGTVSLASTDILNNSTYGFLGVGVVPNVLDNAVVFDGNGTSVRVDDVAGLNLTAAMTVTNNTTTGIHLDNCDGATVDNQLLTGNQGTKGALFFDNCGEIFVGGGNIIGGAGLENSWPLTIGMGSFPAAAGVIPTSGNTNNDIQVSGGSSTAVGTWRQFIGLDYVVTTNGTVEAGGELTIEPGVTVRLNASRRLNFRGDLVAVGTLGQEIVFTKNSGSNWSYLIFETDGNGTFDHCVFEYATYAVYANSTGTISLSNSTLSNCTYGVFSPQSNAVSISDCVLQDNNYGVSASGGTVSLAATNILNNSTYGFLGVGVVPNVLDNAVVFDGNGTGVRVDDVAGLNLTAAMTVTNNTTTGIHLDNCDGATVDNQLLTGNQGTKGALFFEDCGEIFLAAGNTIGGAGLENSWPLSMGMGSFPAVTAVIPTTGNTNNDIQITGGTSSKTGTWRKFSGLDYIVTANGIVSAGGTLVIEPGLIVRLNPSRRLTFRGHLDALGTVGQEIVFTPAGASNWSYLNFETDGSGNFDHCLIEQATYGILAASTGAVSVANTTLQNATYGIYSTASNALTVSDCLVQNNTNGIVALGGSVDLASTAFVTNSTVGFRGTGVVPSLLDTDVTFTDNGTGVRIDDVVGLNLATAMTITGSTVAGIHLDNCESSSVDNQVLTGNVGIQGALYVDDSGDFTLGAGNTIGGVGMENSWPLTILAGTYPTAVSVIPTTGNTNNNIQVTGGASDRSGTWRKFLGLDYVVTNNLTVNAGGELTIEPAVTVRFDASRRLTFSGNLVAVGSAGQEIVFTKDGASPWSYLHFTTDGSGAFDHCLIEEATYGIYAASSGVIDVANTTVQNCNYGIQCAGGNNVALTDCLLEANNRGVNASSGNISFLRTSVINNAVYGVYLIGATPTFGNTLAEWNDIYGNGSGNAGRDLRNNLTDIEAKFVHWGTMDHGDILDQTFDYHDDNNHGYITVLPYVNSQHDTEASAVDDGPGSATVPMAFGLHQNAPNPFNPSTIIRFDLAAASKVQLRVYDISGALVATLLDEQVAAGYHQTVWHGDDEQGRGVASGLYFYRIQAGGNVETRPMMLVK